MPSQPVQLYQGNIHNKTQYKLCFISMNNLRQNKVNFIFITILIAERKTNTGSVSVAIYLETAL